LAVILAASLLLAAAGCSSPDKPRPRAVVPVVRDVPPLLRNTVGSEVTFRNIEPRLVSGYGLVVGLNGTGGDVLPDSIAATMEREMGLRGIGKAADFRGTAIEGMSPREMLRDKNVAVVLVQAAVAPGAPGGSTFDVYVRAINASSLEGGTLWTTELRIGEASVFGGTQTRALAMAKGPVFINPFADAGYRPAANGPSAADASPAQSTSVTQTTGRVLAGGAVTNPFNIEVTLDNESASRARSIVSAINSRFPSDRGDPGQTARGRSSSVIELRVPTRYRGSPSEFLDLVRHLPIDGAYPEANARRFADGLTTDPALGEDLSWCLEAVGQKALPFVRELYDYPELVPQMAALKAGARLNDPQATAPLKRVAKEGAGSLRTQAISFLGEIDGGPSVDLALRELLAERELIVRVAAYEALARRAERSAIDRFERFQRANPHTPAARISPTHAEVLATRNLTAGLQGVDRRFIGGKFFLDRVPGGDPLIYVTQQGQPRIVLFGDTDRLNRPLVVSAWSERLLLNAEPGAEGVRVYYRPPETDRPTISTVTGGLTELVEFFGKKSGPEDPRPGIDLSYSQIVGALYALSQAGGTPAAFATERDRLQAQILAASASRQIADRPETAEDREVVILQQPRSLDAGSTPTPEPDRPPTIVPITPPVDPKATPRGR